MNRSTFDSGYFNGGKHHFPVRVYYEDTDSGGIVYYANYLKFVERARTEFLRKLGFEQSSGAMNYDSVFVVRSCSIDYINSAKLDDLLEIETEILTVRGATVDMRQEVKKNGTEVAAVQVKIVCLAANGQVKRIPRELTSQLTSVNFENYEV